MASLLEHRRRKSLPPKVEVVWVEDFRRRHRQREGMVRFQRGLESTPTFVPTDRLPILAAPGYSFRFGYSPGYGYRYAPTFGYPYGYGYNPFGGFGLGFGLGATIGGPNAGRAVQEYQQERQLDQVKAELQAEKIKAGVMEERLKQLEEQQQQPQPTQ